MQSNHPKNPAIQLNWPVPILTKKLENANEVNPQLIKLFKDHQKQQTGDNTKSYASADDLHQVFKDNKAFAQLAQFISNNVFEMGAAMNGEYWQAMQVRNIGVHLTGIWYQITNNYVFHEMHVHGNCSWSGVYYVQAGESGSVAKEKELGFKNGITRFYGPHLDYQAAGHLDLGNYYTQKASLDFIPEDGKLVVFPSYLKHMPFPYIGKKDRIIVSFHAQITGDTPLQRGYSFS